jgi:hypothetical protein
MLSATGSFWALGIVVFNLCISFVSAFFDSLEQSEEEAEEEADLGYANLIYPSPCLWILSSWGKGIKIKILKNKIFTY